MDDKRLLIFGFGYSAAALARDLLPKGWRITGTARSAEKSKQISALCVTPRLFDTVTAADIERASHILISAGPAGAGDPVLAAYASEITRQARDLAWLGYLSTTGVYGDHGGAWIDEETVPRPGTERGQARLAAEAAWQAIPDLPLHIFRLGGIYGPRRGPFRKIREGTARRVVKPGQVFSRIHVDDIAQVLAASMGQPNPVRIYNVCDDLPAPPEDVLGYAAELLGLPVPPEVPFEEAQLSPMGRSFYAESKRVRNSRIKEELGIRLIYPDYRAGLRALLAAEESRRRAGGGDG